MGITRKIRLTKKTVLLKDCSEVMLWDYLQSVKSKDLTFLVKSGAIPKDEVLIEKMNSIVEEFQSLRGESSMIEKFDLISYKEELVNQCLIGEMLLDMVEHQVNLNIISPKIFNELISELEHWGFRFNKDAPLVDEIKNTRSEIQALQATIKALDEQIYPEAKVNDESDEKEGNSDLEFYSMLLIYERILQKNEIDPKRTSLVKFAALEKEVANVVKRQTKTQKQ